MKYLSMITRTKQATQRGFTLIELMIATLIFSLILIIITAGVLHFTTDYYRGVNSSTTQTAAAQTMNAIAQTLQFSSASSTVGQAPPSGGNPGYLCIGNLQFEYNLGNVQSPSAFNILEFTNGGQCYNDPNSAHALYYTHAPGYGNRRELLQSHMRLTNLVASNPGGGNTWNISVGVAFAETNDLLCDSSLAPGGVGGCKSSALAIANAGIVSAAAASPSHLKCKVQAGSQFCDVAALATTVVQRVQ